MTDIDLERLRIQEQHFEAKGHPGAKANRAGARGGTGRGGRAGQDGTPWHHDPSMNPPLSPDEWAGLQGNKVQAPRVPVKLGLGNGSPPLAPDTTSETLPEVDAD